MDNYVFQLYIAFVTNKPSNDLLSLPNQPDEVYPVSKNLCLIVSLVKKLINTNNQLFNPSQDIILASWRDETAKQYRTYSPLMKLLARWAIPGRRHDGSRNHAGKYSPISATNQHQLS